MVDVEKAVIARLDSHGKHFEILVDPDKALKVRKGKEVDPRELLAYEEVYEDCRKGEKASNSDINKVFGTNKIEKIASKIIRKGKVQLTTEQRRKMREKKEKEIANIISRRAVNPQSNTPHPPKRILNAMEEVGVYIDETKSVSSQLDEVIQALRPVLPISIETIKIAVKFPPESAGKASSKIRGVGKVKKEEWMNDGSWACIIELPAGQQNELYDKVNSISKGEAELKILEE